MKQVTNNKASRGHALLKALGITILALLILASIAGAEPYAYITNAGSNTVSVIDIAINKVTSIVNVGDLPCGVAVNPNGKKVYVTNAGSNNVSIIDTTKNKVIYTLDVESEPFGVAINPAGTKLYVTSIVSNTCLLYTSRCV